MNTIRLLSRPKCGVARAWAPCLQILRLVCSLTAISKLAFSRAFGCVPEEMQHVRLGGVLNGANFPEQKDAPAPILLYAIVGAALTMPMSQKSGGRALNHCDP